MTRLYVIVPEAETDRVLRTFAGRGVYENDVSILHGPAASGHVPLDALIWDTYSSDAKCVALRRTLQEQAGRNLRRYHLSLNDAINAWRAAPRADTGVPAQPVASPTSALDVQAGGSHYKDMAIQPVEFIHKNGLDYFQGNIVKYASRHKVKNGAEDLRKVIHYAQLVLELQYGEKP